MKRIYILLTLLTLVFSIDAVAQERKEKGPSGFDEKLAKRLGADEYGMRSYVYVLLKTGKAQIEDKTERDKLFAGHFENMGKLAKQGKLVMAGPFSDPKGVMRGMFIFNVATIEEAKLLVETDPAVKAGIFDYELTKLYSSAALMMINEIHEKLQKTSIE